MVRLFLGVVASLANRLLSFCTDDACACSMSLGYLKIRVHKYELYFE